LKNDWGNELLLAVSLGLVALVGYGFLFQEGAVPYSAHSDLVGVHLSVKNAAYESMQAGHGLPFWRSDMLSGGPALTHPQAIYTNLLQLPFLFMPPTAASGPSIWLHFLAMALSFQVLGGVLGLGYFARAFMAVAGLFSFKLIIMTYAGWLPVLPGFVTAPLLMAAVFKAIDRPSMGTAGLLALVGAFGLQSGHLQVFYYLALFFGLYVLARCVGWQRAGELGHAGRVVVTCAVAGVLAIASSAFLLLPLLSELDITARTTASYEFLHSGGAYPLERLATFLQPEILGTPLDESYKPVELWEHVAYFGAPAQLLALVGMALGWRRRHVRFLAIGFVASILLVFDTFVLQALYELAPGFSIFRIPSRFLFLTTLFGIALAGVGLEELCASIRRQGALGALIARERAVAIFCVAVVALTAAEGMHYASRYITMARTSDVLPQTDYAEFLSRDPEAFRVAPMGRFALNYGWASFMGLELVTGFEPYNYRHYLQYISLMTTNRSVEPTPSVWVDILQIARWDLLDALNVKYVLTRKRLGKVPPHLRPRASFQEQPAYALYLGMTTSPVYVYENMRAKPRAWLVEDILFADSPEQAAVVTKRANLSRQAVVESIAGNLQLGSDAHGLPLGARNAGDALALVERRAGYLVFDTSSVTDGYAVVSEVWHPGWSATLDGEPVALQRANVALLGVAIPPGDHTLELRFRPLHFDAALLASSAGAGLIALLLVGAIRSSGVGRANVAAGALDDAQDD
jgi:hypothetical protein